MSKENVVEGVQNAPHRSLFHALGLTEEEQKRPLIGIVSSYNEIVPGHMNIDKIVDAVKRSGAQVSGPIPLPTDKEIITILRAVHKYKDSREQFEMRTHKRLIDVLRPTKETTAALESLELPAGVNIVMEIK